MTKLHPKFNPIEVHVITLGQDVDKNITTHVSGGDGGSSVSSSNLYQSTFRFGSKSYETASSNPIDIQAGDIIALACQQKESGIYVVLYLKNLNQGTYSAMLTSKSMSSMRFIFISTIIFTFLFGFLSFGLTWIMTYKSYKEWTDIVRFYKAFTRARDEGIPALITMSNGGATMDDLKVKAATLQYSITLQEN